MEEKTKSKIELADSILEVVEQLDRIIENARSHNSRLGFFAALYREVTIQIQEGIATNFFEDGERMERLDVIFANRYLQALRDFQNGQPPTRSWRLAFEAGASWRPLILQHLLLGINAHINLDLGIAAAQTSPGDALASLKSDFYKINDILSALLEVVQDKISALSPALNLLDKVGGRSDEAIMNFSIQKARDEAWKFAQQLAPFNEEEQETHIQQKDERIVALGKIVRSPVWVINLFTFIIRIFETSKVSKIINVLF
ncbi:MAG: DUF5995 family protein [bacterium]